MPIILLSSFALSLAIVQLVPSQRLAAAMLTVADPLMKVVTPCTATISKTLLPFNNMIGFSIGSICTFVYVFPLLAVRFAAHLTALPGKAAMKCIGLGATDFAKMKAMHPETYKVLFAAPKKLREIGSWMNGFYSPKAFAQGLTIRAQVWVLTPINEEILFRGLLQGPLQRLIKLRTEPGSQAEKRLMRLLFIAIAVVFSLVHAHNLRGPLYRIANPMDPASTCFLMPLADGTKIGLRFKSVLLVTINQCLVNAFTSFFLYSRLFARRGLVASIAAHMTWNLFSGVFMLVLLPINLFESGRYFFMVEKNICSQVVLQTLMSAGAN